MIRPALLLVALAALALLGRLDRDGILARSDVVARAVGIELRVEVTVQRPHPARAPETGAMQGGVAPDTTVVPAGSAPCE